MKKLSQAKPRVREAASVAQYGAFQLTNQFFSAMLDPLVYGGGGMFGGSPAGFGFAPGGGALRLAAEGTQPSEIALAYAKILKAPPAPPAAIIVEPRWNVWAGGYGGANRTQGDPVAVGSHDVSARAGGYAAGLDYRIWPQTTVGVALAGGFTNWGLASGLGGGNSDAFQAGLYGVTRSGPAYLAGALAFAEHWMTTDRFAFLGDHLTAPLRRAELWRPAGRRLALCDLYRRGCALCGGAGAALPQARL